MRQRFFLGLGYIHFSEKKLLKTTDTNNKPSSFFVQFLTLPFPIFGEYEKCTNYVLKVLEHIAKVLKAWK